MWGFSQPALFRSPKDLGSAGYLRREPKKTMVVGGRIPPHAVHPVPTREELALRKKNERSNTTALWATLELLAPSVDENKAQPGYRSKALRGRAKEELLKDVIHAVRLAQGLRSHDLVIDESE